MHRFVQVGQGYERDEFVADEDEKIEYDSDASSSPYTDEDHTLFRRMTKSCTRRKKRHEEEEEEEIYLSEPESDDDLLASFSFSLDRNRLSFQQLYDLHVQYELKRLLYPRADANLQDNSSNLYRQARILYADRLLTQIDASLKNLAFSQAWRPGTLDSVRKMPFLDKYKLDNPAVGQCCDACQRAHTVVTHVVYFWGAHCKEGKPVKNAKKQIDRCYQEMNGEQDDDDIAIGHARKMFVGNTCAARLKLYHTLYHRDTHLMIELIKDLQSMKRNLSSFRVLREGKRIPVEASAEKLEKAMVQDVTPIVAAKWAYEINKAIAECADFTEGGKHVWSKRKDTRDINLFSLDASDSDGYSS